MPANLSQDIFNSIRNAADAQYQARIPEATRNNIAEYALAMSTYTAQYNQFMSALIDRIGRVIIKATTYTNPLAQFKRGEDPLVQDIHEIFIEPTKSEGNYNP